MAVTPTLAPTKTTTPSPTPKLLADASFQISGVPFLETPPATVPCDGQGGVYRGRFQSRVWGPWRDYHVYLPPCYGRDERVYPVVYLIHGSIQSDSHWLDLGLAAYADAGINDGRYPPFIAIMPYSGRLGNISSGGRNSIEAVTIEYLMPHVDKHYCTWSTAAGRSIGGISRGGYWALEIAFMHPQMFSAVAGHSSHLRLETDSARYNPLATYDTADLSNMRIWLDRGESDFLRTGQDQLHEHLTAASIPHEYRVNPGGHSDGYWAAHLPEYLDWHLSAWPRDRGVYPPCGKSTLSG